MMRAVKRIAKVILFTVVTLLLFIIVGEAYYALFDPQPYFYPKLSYSTAYRKLAPANIKIEHRVPPVSRFYTINSLSMRGREVALSDTAKKITIFVLGDSYAFGMGVNDGDEFAEVMRKNLGDRYRVINAGGCGWGLTQEIRRFYDLNREVNPAVVALLFCDNDPEDNLKDNCTAVNGGKFTFHDFSPGDNSFAYMLNKSLSRSIIQKSNLYNAISRVVWSETREAQIETTRSKLALEARSNGGTTISAEERVYIELLEAFAGDLHKRGIRLLFLSVNAVTGVKIFSHVDEFPNIKAAVSRLETDGKLEYIDINGWFTIGDMALSPVSHFDAGWHAVLGKGLAASIKRRLTDEK
jgi:hypothetical protein